MHNDQRPTQSGLSRRAMMKAAAWSAPVVAVAAATPAAAASTTGFEVFPAPPQMGSAFPVFNTDFTQIYSVPEPTGFSLLNSGTEDWPGGAIVTYLFDNRIFAVTGAEATANPSGGGPTNPIGVTVVDLGGNQSQATFTVPNPIPAGTAMFDPGMVLVRMVYDIVALYPNDAIDQPLDSSWTVAVPGNLGDDVRTWGPYSADVRNAVAPWGLEMSAATTSDIATTNCVLTVPTAGVITSVGPNPTPGNAVITMTADAAVITGVSIGTLTLNGMALSGVAVENGGGGVWDIDLGQPLQSGDVVAIELDVTSNPQVSLQSASYAALWAHVTDPAPSDTDRRGADSSASFTNDQCAV